MEKEFFCLGRLSSQGSKEKKVDSRFSKQLFVKPNLFKDKNAPVEKIEFHFTSVLSKVHSVQSSSPALN